MKSIHIGAVKKGTMLKPWKWTIVITSKIEN